MAVPITITYINYFGWQSFNCDDDRTMNTLWHHIQYPAERIEDSYPGRDHLFYYKCIYTVVIYFKSAIEVYIEIAMMFSYIDTVIHN